MYLSKANLSKLKKILQNFLTCFIRNLEFKELKQESGKARKVCPGPSTFDLITVNDEETIKEILHNCSKLRHISLWKDVP